MRTVQSRIKGYDYINRQRSFFNIQDTNPKLWLSADKNVGTMGARVFTRANSEIFPFATSLDPGTSSFWVSYWVKPAAITAATFFTDVITGGTGAGITGFWVVRYADYLRSYFNTVAGGAVIIAIYTDLVFTVGKWAHVVVLYDRVSGLMTAYKDTIRCATPESIAAKNDACSPSGSIASGIGGYLTNHCEDGSLSRFAYGQGTLPTVAEITELYNQGNGKYYAELSLDLSNKVTHYWNMNEVSGNAIDAKANNDGTDTNTVTAGPGPREATAIDTIGDYHGVLTNMDNVNAWSSDVPNVPSCLGGYSLTFDGTDDVVVVGNVGNVTAIEFYVKSLTTNQELLTLASSTATAITVVAGTLTFGGSLTVSAITVDDISKTAAQAGALINDGTWHKVSLAITSIAASNLKFGTDSSAFGNVRLDEMSVNGGSSRWKFNDGPQFGESSDGDPICTWESREGNRYQANQVTASLCPTYIRGAVNGQPAIDFDGVDDFLEFIDAIGISTGAGHCMIVSSQDANKLATIYSQSDEAVATRFFDLGAAASGFLSYNQNDAGTVDTLNGNTPLGTAYKLLEISSNGTLVAMKVNQAVQTITVASGGNNGDWVGDVTGPDNSILGALKTTAVSKYFAGRIAEIIYWDAALSSDNANAVRVELANKYGIVLV
jgi:hypothetical protein